MFTGALTVGANATWSTVRFLCAPVCALLKFKRKRRGRDYLRSAAAEVRRPNTRRVLPTRHPIPINTHGCLSAAYKKPISSSECIERFSAITDIGARWRLPNTTRSAEHLVERREKKRAR
ncbi:uncharacterized protein LOC142775075 isoform X2 [Rhipicephalus microplus]|uniref:uncharacterized protein LOC142775075 isoform X2 n=1 Tax=Rhipicephalus microplus TaxID=6941 RepID=UPI003F6C30EE